MDLVRRHIVPFFDTGYGDFIVVYADTIHPLFLLCNMDNGNKGLTGCFEPILGEIRSGKGYLQGLADNQGLCQREMIKRRQFLGIDIV